MAQIVIEMEVFKIKYHTRTTIRMRNELREIIIILSKKYKLSMNDLMIKALELGCIELQKNSEKNIEDDIKEILNILKNK